MSPTNLQLKIVLTGEDYGLKVSIRENKGRAISEPACLDDFTSIIQEYSIP